MRRAIMRILISIVGFSLLVGCGSQPTGTNVDPAPAATAAEKTQSAPSPTAENLPSIPPTAVQTIAPTAGPKRLTPSDIFGSEFNPFYSVDFPKNFNIYSAEFFTGNPKFEGKPKYVLSLTAEGSPDSGITFLAKLAGIEDVKRVNDLIKEFNLGGFCEFQSKDGVLFTLRKTIEKDGRYKYVEGFHADLMADLDPGKVPGYVQLVSDNYNIKALSKASDYFDTTPDFKECSLYVNRDLNLAETSLIARAEDVQSIQQKMAKGIKSKWYDPQNGKMGVSYGMIDYELWFDNKGSQIIITEKSADLQTAMSDYIAPDLTLSMLGFTCSEKDALCIIEDKKQGVSFAIHKPEWGSAEKDWNFEYLQELNGYLLVVWYYVDEQKFTVQADKGSSSAKYDYFIKTGEYGNEYPAEKAKQHFSTVFATQDANVYEKPLVLLRETLQDRFSLTLDKLYSLPIK